MVYINLSKSAIQNSSAGVPKAINREYEERPYDYYGRPAYWSAQESSKGLPHLNPLVLCSVANCNSCAGSCRAFDCKARPWRPGARGAAEHCFRCSSEF